MKKVIININKFSCRDDENTIVKKYEKEYINDKGEKEEALVCDVFLSPLKGVRYDGTNKDNAMLALLGADSLEEMREIANGEESMMEVVHHLEDMLHDEKFIKKYKEEVTEQAYKIGYDEGYDDGSNDERILVSTKLLKKKFDHSFISDITGLPLSKIKAIESDII